MVIEKGIFVMNTIETKCTVSNKTVSNKNGDAEAAFRPLTVEEISNIDGGRIIDAAKELIRLLRTAGEPQL